MPGQYSSIRVRDFTFRCSDADDVLGILESFVLDVYDHARIGSGMTVVDIGAGIGDFAVMASRSAGPTGRVIAIEPNPADFQCLLANLESNHCTNVVAHNVAIGSDEGFADLTFKGQSFRAPVHRLSSVLRMSGLSKGDRVGFLKIDIEGAERGVIPDNMDRIAECDTVAVEFHGGAHAALVPQVEALGFRFERFGRTGYLSRVLAFAVRHPIQSARLYRLLKQSRPASGVGKLVEGLDIARSESLVVGVFRRTQPGPNSGLR